MSRLQHVVLIKFPRSLTQAELDGMDALFSSWPNHMDGIQSHHWGLDVSGRSRGYQFGMVMEFESLEHLKAYTPHPKHQEFAQWVAAQGGEVLAFDFPIE